MVKCSKCGELIDELVNIRLDLRSPCPSCGSKARRYAIEVKGEIAFHEKLQLKARHGKVGEVKPFLELQTVDSFYLKTGEWSHAKRWKTGKMTTT